MFVSQREREIETKANEPLLCFLQRHQRKKSLVHAGKISTLNFAKNKVGIDMNFHANLHINRTKNVEILEITK